MAGSLPAGSVVLVFEPLVSAVPEAEPVPVSLPDDPVESDFSAFFA